MREYEPLIKENHSIYERFKAIIETFDKYGISNVLQEAEVSLDFNEKEGIFVYFFNLNKTQFKLSKEFRMELKELAYAEFEDVKSNKTNIDIYRFQGMHTNSPNGKKDYIAFDFEPNKTRYPKVHINADKKTWGDHLTFPTTTNLNINRMSCPLALKVFERYSSNIDDFPANTQNNNHYVKIFEEVNEYGI